MKARKGVIINDAFERNSATSSELGRPLFNDQRVGGVPSEPSNSVVIGELISLTDDGHTPLILFPGQMGSAAVRARSCVNLCGTDIGKRAVLAFENGDVAKPLVIGLLRETDPEALKHACRQTEVEVDDARLIVTAKRQLTLRCGDASITLTREGKVIIQGTFVSTRSSGVNRIVGGSVQIN